MKNPATAAMLALVMSVLAQPCPGATGKEYEPTAEEIIAFEQAVMDRSARTGPKARPGSEYADHDRFKLVSSIAPTLDLQPQDKAVVDQILSNEQEASRLSKFQAEVCRQLTSDNVLFVDTDYLVRTMVEGQESIHRHQREAYDQMRRRMSAQGFTELNSAINEMLSTAHSFEIDPAEVFSFGAAIVKWQMKKNCESDEPITQPQGALRAAPPEA